MANVHISDARVPRHCALFALLISLLCFSRCDAAQLTLYVATNGSDRWSGRIAGPNKSATDGPFKTIERAQKAVRDDAGAHSVTVEIRGGVYILSEPLEFTPADSGVPNAPILYAAYENEHPVFSGGVQITGWHTNSLGQWEASLPDVKNGSWNFSQLFVNGQRRYRPRLPKEGYFKVAAQGPPAAAGGDQIYDQYQFNPGEISNTWTNMSDVEVYAFHIWGMAHLHVASVDETTNTLRMDAAMSSNEPDWGKFLTGNRYLIENVKEALDAPGQWYLDRPTGMLTYIPMPGESPEKSEVIAPKLDHLMRLTGSLAAHSWVHDITFRGLSFDFSNWVDPQGGHDYAQADVDLPCAVSAIGARNCRFEGCTIEHVGTYGLGLGVACQDNDIYRCSIRDLGAGAVKIGDPSPGGDGYNAGDPEMVTTGNTVEESDLYGGGRLFPAGVGVYIANCPGNIVRKNAIHNFYYTGVSLGWVWGYGESQAKNNVVSDNDIFQIGQGVLSDMGGIYSVGARAGTLENHNRIHDIRSFSYGGWGIYFDEGSSDVLATNNLVYDTSAAGFHQHYGQENVLSNNIFAFGSEAQLMRTRAEDHLSFTLQHNIVLSGGPPMLGSNWSGSHYALDYNDYWTLGGAAVSLNGMTFGRWRQTGQDIHSVVADPGFVDPAKYNFHIVNRSAADQIGFKTFDVDHFGPSKPYSDPVLTDAFPITPAAYVH